MKKLSPAVLLFTIAAVLGMAACNSGETPLQRNQQIVAMNDSLSMLGQRWGEQFAVAAKSKDWQSLRPYREKLQQFATTASARVAAMDKVGKEFDGLQSTLMHYMKYEVNAVSGDLAKVENLSADVSTEEISAVISKLTDASGEEAELRQVRAAQQRYATANGFRLQAIPKVAPKQ